MAPGLNRDALLRRIVITFPEVNLEYGVRILEHCPDKLGRPWGCLSFKKYSFIDTNNSVVPDNACA